MRYCHGTAPYIREDSTYQGTTITVTIYCRHIDCTQKVLVTKPREQHDAARSEAMEKWNDLPGVHIT